MFHHQLAAILAAAALTLSANVYAAETLSLLKLFPLSPLQRALKRMASGARLTRRARSSFPFLMTRKQFPFLILKTRKLTLRARRAVTT